MKTLIFIYKFLLISFFCLCSTSCSKENTAEENSIEKSLIENSPWVFDHYELKEIKEGENLGKEFLENDVNDDYFNLEFNFYKNGIASLKYPDSELTSFNWSLSNNTLIGIPDPDFDDTFYLKNITVSESQLTFELEHYTFNADLKNETIHSGIFYFY